MEAIQQILNSDTSRINFMKGLILLSRADGNIDEGEQAFFINAAAAIGLSENYMQAIKDLMTDEKIENDILFQTKQQSLFFMREALQLCYLDNVYHENEKAIINQIGNNNSLSKASIESIESWVVEGMTWKAAGEKLLDLEV